MQSPHQQNASEESFAAHYLDLLWQSAQAAGTPRVYAIFDGAKDKKLLPLINNSGLEHACLFSGKLSYALQRAAPHLVKFERGHPYALELMSRVLSQQCGLFALTDNAIDLSDMRKHCRRIAKVRAPSGKSLFFRYYDAQILWSLLPVCSLDELTLLLGPMRYVLAPDAKMETAAFKAVCRHVNNLHLINHKIDVCHSLDEAAPFKSFPYIKAFQLRQPHLDVFDNKADLEFFKRIYKSYRRIYGDSPEKTFPVGNQELALPAFLWRCYSKGLEYKLENAYHFSVFFHLCSQYGWEFWQNDKARWATEILELARPAEIRIEKIERKLSSRLLESLWS